MNYEDLRWDNIVTPIKIDKYESLLKESGFDREISQILIEGFTKGFDLGYRGPKIRRDKAENIPITVGSKTDMWNKIMKEVSLGRYAGPFSYQDIPFESFIQSPIGLVPKSGNKTRLIFHLSYDFGKPDENDKKSVNFHTPEEFCTVQYRDLDYAIRTCLGLCKNLQHWDENVSFFDQDDDIKQLFFGKSDLLSAFRILPILVSQRKFLLLKATHPITNETSYFVEKNLPFGASVSCKNFTYFSDSLQHITEYLLRKKFVVTNYLDDFLFVANSQSECNHMVSTFLQMCENIGCPVSFEKTEWATQSIIFLGILLNGRNKTLSIPIEKKTKALNLLNWVTDRRKVTIKTIQRLTGILNFLNKAIVPGRAFTKRMYTKLKLRDRNGNLLKQFHHVSLGKEFLRDCEVWKGFLRAPNPTNLCRPFTDIDKFTYAVTLNFYSDASLNPKYGLGAVFDNRFVIARWNENFIINEKPSIEFLELYALCIGLCTWGNDERLKNTKLIIFCDNDSVRHMVNNFASNCGQCMKLIRLLALDGIRYNRRVFVKHVKTKLNTLADALSRMNLKRFWKYAPKSMNKYPDNIPPTIWPVEKFWFSD